MALTHQTVLARTFSRKTYSRAMLAGQTTLDVFSDSAQCEKRKLGSRAKQSVIRPRNSAGRTSTDILQPVHAAISAALHKMVGFPLGTAL